MEAAEDRPDWTREVAALRRVARALLDEHAADDVLQEAWLRAHDRGASSRRPVAYWKRAIANLARDRRRGEARRAEREARAARDEALPSTDEVAARLELVQRVARAAAELPEPYRSTIHLHYFEERSAPEIAALAGVSLETVRTRIRRGLERMRARLDSSTGGDRRAWCLALAPLVQRRANEAPLVAGASFAALGGLIAMSKLAFVAAVALVAVAALWFASRASPSAAPGDVRPSASIALAERAARPDAPAELPPPSDAAPGEGRMSLATTSQPDDGVVEVEGTFTLRDGEGRARPDTDGYFFLERPAGQGDSLGEPVRFESGRWSARASVGEVLTFHSAYADGHPARRSGEPVTVGREGQVAFTAAAWPRTFLRVVDAASGADLSDVELRWGQALYMPEAERHPGDAGDGDVRLTGLSSPFSIDLPGAMREDATLRLWVSAQDRAWSFCDVLPSVGGTRTVALSACGELEVHPVGPRPDRPWVVTMVEIEPGVSEQVVGWQRPAEGAITRLDRLAPGTYSVHARYQDLRPGLVGTSGEFEVRAGETTRVTLPLERPTARPLVHVSGSLSYPEGIALGDLVIEPLARDNPQSSVVLSPLAMRPDASHPRTLHWDAGSLGVGEYLVTGPGLREVFDTGAGPVRRLALELPPEVTVFVRVVDARDGEPIAGATLGWTQLPPVNGAWGMWTEVSDPTDQGQLRFRAPAVSISLDVSAPGWGAEHLSMELDTAGPNEIEVRLTRETGLRVRLMEGDAVVPGLWARPRLLDPAGQPVPIADWAPGPTDCRILAEPGDYRLEFVEIDRAWQRPAAIDVRIVEGALTPVDVPVVRAP